MPPTSAYEMSYCRDKYCFDFINRHANKKEIGCFADKREDRAISDDYVEFDPSEVLEKCQKKAEREGHSHFGIQYQKYCFMAKEGGKTYNKHGKADGCENGKGGNG